MSYEKEINDYVLIQYIIIFALAQTGKPIGYDVLINILTEHADINYIEFRLALDNLVCSGFVRSFSSEANRPMYGITEKGMRSAPLFEHDIPIYIREPILKAVAPNIEKDQKKRLIRTSVRSEEENMHYADCAVFDDDDTALMKISVFTPEREAAVEITKRFKENPDKIYAQILNILAD